MQEVKDFLKNESILKRVDSCFVMADPEYIGVFLAVDSEKKWTSIVFLNDKDFEVSEDPEDIEKYYSQAVKNNLA